MLSAPVLLSWVISLLLRVSTIKSYIYYLTAIGLIQIKDANPDTDTISKHKLLFSGSYPAATIISLIFPAGDICGETLLSLYSNRGKTHGHFLT